MNQKLKTIISDLRDIVDHTIVTQQTNQRTFIPTGAQDELIEVAGNFDNRLYLLALHNNNMGKTTGLVNILANFQWPELNPDYFPDKKYREWPFLKKWLLMSSKTNIGDNGPFRTEILNWWPTDKYKALKGREGYHSTYQTSNGWKGVVKSYHVGREEIEGSKYGFIGLDEPFKNDLLGAITTRIDQGGLIVHTMTPIECGTLLDEINDLKEKGYPIIELTGSVYDSCSKTGKWNRKKTKRGRMSPEQIDQYIAGVPESERDARIMGKRSAKNGKLHPSFDPSVHVISVDLSKKMYRSANAYMAIDPARSHYPAINWFLVLQDGTVVIYNEYPTFNTFNAHFNEVRFEKPMDLTIAQLSDKIKAFDLPEYGFDKQIKRIGDPYFFAQTIKEDPETPGGLTTKFAEHGIHIELPPRSNLETSIETINQELKYNVVAGVTEFNRPNLYIMKHCTNTIRSVSRISWGEKGDIDAKNPYKDHWDNISNFYRYHNGTPKYIDNKSPKETTVITPWYQ